MKEIKIVAISSLPCHGNAGLKPLMTVLTNHVIPVPSLLLTATTNIRESIKTQTNFEQLLEGSLELCRTKGYEVVLLCGYFYKVYQIDFTLKMAHKFKDTITRIIVDPILGDNDRMYVEENILDRLPDLFSIADIVLPNLTELKLLTDKGKDIEQNIDELLTTYPSLTLIVKSITNKKGKIGIRIQSSHLTGEYFHSKIPVNYGGAGDFFLSCFLLFYLIRKHNIIKSVKMAAKYTMKTIKWSYRHGSDELIACL